MRIRSARAVRGDGRCWDFGSRWRCCWHLRFFCGGCGWDCMWSSAGAGRGGFDDWSLPGPAGTVQRDKKRRRKPKTGKPKKEPKDLAEAAKNPEAQTGRSSGRRKDAVARRQKALRRTRRGIRVDPLRLSATLGGAEDPAAAAELYGGLHALVWTGMPALEKLVVIRDPGFISELILTRRRPGRKESLASPSGWGR